MKRSSFLAITHNAIVGGGVAGTLRNLGDGPLETLCAFERGLRFASLRVMALSRSFCGDEPAFLSQRQR
jgi:hypothetical protein